MYSVWENYKLHIIWYENYVGKMLKGKMPSLLFRSQLEDNPWSEAAVQRQQADRMPRDEHQTHRVKSWEKADRWRRVQRNREKLLHAQRGLDSGQSWTHQGRHEAILTCVTCRREQRQHGEPVTAATEDDWAKIYLNSHPMKPLVSSYLICHLCHQCLHPFSSHLLPFRLFNTCAPQAANSRLYIHVKLTAQTDLTETRAWIKRLFLQLGK